MQLTSKGPSEQIRIYGMWSAGTAPGTYFIVRNNGGTLEVIDKFIVPVGLPGTFAIRATLPAGSYTVGPTTAGPGTIAVYSGRWNDSGQTWTIGDFNSTITATLNNTRNIASSHASLSGVNP